MPEWYLVVTILTVLSAIGLLWKPLLVCIPLALVAAGVTVTQAVMSSASASHRNRSERFATRLKVRGLTTLLFLVQPLARLGGRLRHGLTPWRKRCARRFALPWPRTTAIWSERHRTAESRLESIESTLRSTGTVVMRGREHSAWDLQVWGGLFGAVRARMAVEEHDSGSQRVRLRLWPKVNPLTPITLASLSALSIAAAADQAWTASAILALLALFLLGRNLADAAAAMASCVSALKSTEKSPSQTQVNQSTIHCGARPSSDLGS
jgi:hypothetical protein